MNKFKFLFYSPDDNGGGGLDSIVADAVNEGSEGSGEGSGSGDEVNIPDDNKPGDTSAADKGDSGNDDPEYELDFEFEQGKGKHKMKLSDLKQGAKWVHDNRQAFASMLKIQELAGKNPEFKSVLSGVLAKSFNDKGEINKEFITKTMAVLEDKVEAAQAKTETAIDQKDENILEMEKLLEDLEPDSAQAKLLSKSIATQKALRAQLVEKSAAMEKMLKEMGERLSGVENAGKEAVKRQSEQAFNAEVQKASKIFTETFTQSISGESGINFVDDEDKTIFEGEVRNIVAANAEKIKDDAGYRKTIQDAIKSVSLKYGKRREAIVNDYLRRKNGDKPKDNNPEKSKEKPSTTLEEELSSLISGATEEQFSDKR